MKTQMKDVCVSGTGSVRLLIARNVVVKEQKVKECRGKEKVSGLACILKLISG